MPTNVRFTATVDGDGIVVWNVEGQPAKHHRTRVEAAAPPERIRLSIDDQTNRGLRFDCSFPFQVWEQEGCPPAQILTNQIQVISCNPENVEIRDKNTGPERRLRYRLNVVDRNGNPVPCDPIIENGGGGSGIDAGGG